MSFHCIFFCIYTFFEILDISMAGGSVLNLPTGIGIRFKFVWNTFIFVFRRWLVLKELHTVHFSTVKINDFNSNIFVKLG